jgi:hypothetical protein
VSFYLIAQQGNPTDHLQLQLILVVRKKEKNGTMRILRWIVFLPVAVIVGLVAGKLGEILGVLIFRGKTWSSYLFSGLLISGCFILVGLKVAPLRNTLVKWILIAPCLAFGIMSTIGSLLTDKPVSAFAGLGIILVGLAFFAMRPKTVQNHEQNKPSEQDPTRNDQ